MSGRPMVAALAGGAAAILAYRRLITPWHEQWGASDAEAAMSLPGDDLIDEPAQQCTRAITIDAPPEAVWPWLIQIGADRGGFYSYDWLENLFGLGIHSADRIVPEWQHRSVGDLVAANATGTGGWCVMEIRPNEVLVLQVANMETGRPLRRDEQLGWSFVWIFALTDRGDGSSRLLVRERVGFDRRLTQWAMAPVGPISFIMTRPMLRGIKSRAEHHNLRIPAVPDAAP